MNKDCALSASPDTFKRHSGQLTQALISQADEVVKQIKSRRNSQRQFEESLGVSPVLPQNYFLARVD